MALNGNPIITRIDVQDINHALSQLSKKINTSSGTSGPTNTTAIQGVRGNQGLQGVQGVQGIQGPPGPSGDGGDASRLQLAALAGENITATEVLYQAADKRVFKADSSNIDHADKILGVALQSVNAGLFLDILISGIIVDTAFSAYPTDSLLFLNGVGSLSASAPASGFSLAIGKHTDANTFNVDKQQPIFLA